MLKKIALSALFAITFAVGAGAAHAGTTISTKAASSPNPQLFCPVCVCRV